MRIELKKIIDKSGEILEDARYLLAGTRYEAAVNRAYYSMFTAIQGLLLNKDIFVKTHSGAKAKFHEFYLKTNLLPLEFGKIFENASALRQEADYDFDMDISEEDAKQTINDANKFLMAVISFLESH